jgi:porin
MERVLMPHRRHPILRSFILGALALGAVASNGLAQESDTGLSLTAGYTGDVRRNTTGGLRTGTAYSDSLDLGLTWTTDGLFPAARMTTNVAVMHLSGPGITGKYVGDFQSVNNIEADHGWYLYESWVELAFGDRGSSVRAGVMDLSAEFDTPVTSGLFTGSPFGIGTEISQSGERGPNIWPVTGLGVRAYGEFTPGVHWRVAAYDGEPGSDRGDFTDTRVSRHEGALLIGELE